MNWDKADNSLDEFRRQVEERWRELSPGQVSGIAGRREKLAEELQRTYGWSAQRADAEIRDLETGQAATSSGRGKTERAREFGAGNQPASQPGADDQRH